MLSSRPSAYSTLWWIGFYTFCLVPIMVLSIGIGRYFYARAEMFKSADGAALAAVQEVDVQAYLNTGQIVLLPSAYGRAQEYAAFNSDYLTGHKIYPRVTAIRVDQAGHKVFVSLQADASSLFPALLGGVRVNGEGEAEVRIGNR
jgi:Putative Flp pilus-assembly TadE/G-like